MILKKIKIGNIEFDRPPLILAPMEDVSDPPFRMICRNMGADWVYSEFVASDGLIRDSIKSKHKLDISNEERPVSIQIFGANIDAVVEAAKIVESVKPDFIDLNFGCPVKKVAAKGAGAGLLNDVEKMARMSEAVVRAVKIPVTVKTRLGWDQKNQNIIEIAERLQDTGISAIAIHGRTRCQLYKGVADWSLIGAVKNNPNITIPVIGNGDIIDGQSARNALEKYNVDGIMIGRAAIGNPWVFNEIKSYLNNSHEIPRPDIKERVETCLQHLKMSVDWKGEKTAVFEMRKHYSNYFKGIKNFKPIRIKLVTAGSFNEVENILKSVLIDYQY